MVSLVLCFAMLLGTTFAWFTDTASTSVNKIQAGTLKVSLEMATGKNADGNTTWKNAKGETLDFVTADNRTEILWELGATYHLPELRIKNDGSLALKYKVVITGIKGDAKLNEAIDWTITTKDVKGNEITTELGEDHSLAAKDFNTVTISGTMKTSAGNAYQDLSIDGISITVYAAQDTVEFDSTTDQYDKDALYRTIIQTEGKLGTYYGKDVDKTLESYDFTHTFNRPEKLSDIALWFSEGKITLKDVNFNTVTTQEVEQNTNNWESRYIGMYVNDGATLVIDSGEYIANGINTALIYADHAQVIINGGTFKSNATGWAMIQAPHNNTITINGGFFDQSEGNPNITLQWKNSTTLVVKGGTFVNYDPEYHKAVAEGYHVETLPQEDGTTWYKVVAD